MTEDELQHAMERMAAATEFPPEVRTLQASPPITDDETAAYVARLRNGYFIPDRGAFDFYEDDEDDAGHQPGSFTVPSPNPIPFHIGSKIPAVHHVCSACQCIVFHLGIGPFYTALRCANCGREWCQHEG